MKSPSIRNSWLQHVAESAACTPQEMSLRVARFGDIPSSPKAFADTHLPGHQRTLFSVIGSGVTDDPSFKPKIAAAEHFHIDYIVAPKGCGAALHWHDTEEVFIAQAGRWQVDWVDGSSGQTHSITLNPRDTISVPPFVHRSFQSLDGEDGLLISILGGRKPSPVKWHPSVAERAIAAGVGFDAKGAVVVDFPSAL
jgi:mannose-6-phosphate isomerase-like protein (cupin superfamily)